MLTSKQRSRLAGIAQTRDALVTLGKAGPSEGLTARLDALLSIHELVKLRFGDKKESKQDLAAQLAKDTSSELVRLVGNVAVFWRRNSDPELRKIDLED